jgi:hypothetical protein
MEHRYHAAPGGICNHELGKVPGPESAFERRLPRRPCWTATVVAAITATAFDPAQPLTDPVQLSAAAIERGPAASGNSPGSVQSYLAYSLPAVAAGMSVPLIGPFDGRSLLRRRGHPARRDLDGRLALVPGRCLKRRRSTIQIENLRRADVLKMAELSRPEGTYSQEAQEASQVPPRSPCVE